MFSGFDILKVTPLNFFLNLFVNFGGPEGVDIQDGTVRITGLLCMAWQTLGKIEWTKLRDKEGSLTYLGWSGIVFKGRYFACII